VYEGGGFDADDEPESGVCRPLCLKTTRLDQRTTLDANAAFDMLLWLGEGAIIAAIAVAARPSGLFATRRDIRVAIAAAQGKPLPRCCTLCLCPWGVRSPPCNFACVHDHLVCADCTSLAARRGAIDDRGRPARQAWQEVPMGGEEGDYDEANSACLASRIIPCPVCSSLHPSPTPASVPTLGTVFSTVTAWAWLPDCTPVDVGLPVVEVADLPSDIQWRLVREAATCRLFDERVAARISRVLSLKGIEEDAFWAKLARDWALQVHAGDLKCARRTGLGKNPAQEFLRQVPNPTFHMLLREVHVPRTEDVIARRTMLESGRHR